MMSSNGHSKTAKKRTWIKRVLLTVLVGGLVAGIAVALMPKPVLVELATIERGVMVVTVEEDGVSRVHDKYVVSAPLTGNLARLDLDAGDMVKQGQVLARILPLSSPLLDRRSRSEAEARVAAALAGRRQAAAQIERAKAALDFAREEATTVRNLLQQGTVNRQELSRAELEERSRQAELTSAEFAAKVSEHELQMARSALGRLGSPGGADGDQFEVTSPITGQVLRLMQESEGVVQAGTPLVEVGDPRALEIAVDVLTSDAIAIAEGAPVTIREWGGEPLSGHVRMIEPAAFTRVSALGVEEQRVNAVIELEAPYERYQSLGDGYRVLASIEVYRAADALLVPGSALFRSGDDWAIYVEAEGVAQKRVVEVGRRNAMFAEVLGGVDPGARVVLHPSDRVRPGVPVAAQ